MDSISLDATLALDGTPMDHINKKISGNNFLQTFVTSGCQHGTWLNGIAISLTFPSHIPPYNPPSLFLADNHTFNIVNCPGDNSGGGGCAVVCLGGGGGAESAVSREPSVRAS
jgi:hypothetical protein